MPATYSTAANSALTTAIQACSILPEGRDEIETLLIDAGWEKVEFQPNKSFSATTAFALFYNTSTTQTLLETALIVGMSTFQASDADYKYGDIVLSINDLGRKEPSCLLAGNNYLLEEFSDIELIERESLVPFGPDHKILDEPTRTLYEGKLNQNTVYVAIIDRTALLNRLQILDNGKFPTRNLLENFDTFNSINVFIHAAIPQQKVAP